MILRLPRMCLCEDVAWHVLTGTARVPVLAMGCVVRAAGELSVGDIGIPFPDESPEPQHGEQVVVAVERDALEWQTCRLALPDHP